MDYPAWAPTILINQHKMKLCPNTDGALFYSEGMTITTDGNMILDHELIISAILKKDEFKNATNEDIQILRRNVYKKFSKFGLPHDESTELLGRLLTDPRMKPVWSAISKRNTDEEEDLKLFIFVCEQGIVRWRGDQELTRKERKKFYLEISKYAEKLQALIYREPEFSNYKISHLINDQSIELMLKFLEAKSFGNQANDLIIARQTLDSIFPSLLSVLSDIGNTAKYHAAGEPLVLKPNSKNSELHYFIRYLSEYFYTRYDQPLHEVVAITASVVFGQEVDSDLVRNIVKIQPVW